jgi:hypothetical protein
MGVLSSTVVVLVALGIVVATGRGPARHRALLVPLAVIVMTVLWNRGLKMQNIGPIVTAGLILGSVALPRLTALVRDHALPRLGIAPGGPIRGTIAALLVALAAMLGTVQIRQPSGDAPRPAAADGAATETAPSARCDLRPAMPSLAALPPGRVMTLADWGARLLAHTRHIVYSIPNHRAQPGFVLAHRLFAAPAEDKAAQDALLARTAPDYLLLCRSAAPGIARYFGLDLPGSLGAALAAGQVPPWMTRVPLPAAAGPLLLFRVHGRP